MGYTTWFSGSFSFNKPVEKELVEYINRFSTTRRMPRDNEKIKEIYPDWEKLCFFGKLGNKGEYFVPISNTWGQDKDESIIDYNGFREHVHPGLWCQWVVSEDGTQLEWDGGEKFYNYVEWLEYLIGNFFAPLGYVLNGNVEFQGEDYDDFGTISVEDNIVDIQYGMRVSSLDDIADYELIEALEKRGYEIFRVTAQN
jgi:hypothetical protein